MDSTATTRTPSAYNRFVNHLLAAWRAVMLCRCSVVVVIIVCVALQVTQSVEALLVLGEDSGPLYRQMVLLGIAAIGFSLTCWYCPRVLQYRLSPRDLASHQLVTFISVQLPRICAVAPLLALSLAFSSAAGRRNGADSPASEMLYVTAVSTGVVGVLMYVLLTYRIPWVARRRPELLRQWMKARGELKTAPPVSAEAEASAPVESAAPPAPSPSGSSGLAPYFEGYRVTPLRLMPWSTIAAALVIMGLAIALLALFITRPQSAAWFGPMTIVFASAAIWVAFGTMIAYVGTRLRLPLFLLLIALGCLFSGFDLNDNHEVRHTAIAPVAAKDQTFDKTFDEWLSSRPDLNQFDETGYPVVIVCCEGGGLYAAYHTAYQLAAFQDENPAFASHVFAISSVSGGSLGSAVFASLVHRYGTTKPPQGSMKAAVADVLADDFLSPLFATALYPDLLQRIWFKPIPSFDRARALEQGFERAWTTKTAGHEFEAPFDDLGPTDSAHAVPYLILNTTNVESGGRTVITRLPLDGPYFTTVNLLSRMHPYASLPLSTAVGLSSRFPYITPAGYLRTPKGDKLRYVDGGYFEDTGVATGLDLLNALVEHRGWSRGTYRFIVIRIGLSDNARDENVSLRHSLKYTWQGMGESLSPVRALLNTRSARGTAAVESLNDDLIFRIPGPRDRNFPFALVQGRVPLPLGWLISGTTRREIEDQVKGLQKSFTDRMLREISTNPR